MGNPRGGTHRQYMDRHKERKKTLRDKLYKTEHDGIKESSFTKGALDQQVGGDHYKKWTIQPIEFITKNELSFLQGCIIKRIVRYNQNGGKGLQDLEKIKHEIDLIIELEGLNG